MALIQKPSLIEYKNARFLITDAPTDQNISSYLKVFREHNVVALTRTCHTSYSDETLRAQGVEVYEMPFADGASPPNDVITRWLAVVNDVFNNNSQPHPTIAIHCVAGLGRAPVLVGVALIELGMQPLEAINFIRQRRPRALNIKQVGFLESYKRRHKQTCCTIL